MFSRNVSDDYQIELVIQSSAELQKMLLNFGKSRRYFSRMYD